MRNISALVLALMTSVVISACGGGSNGNGILTPPTQTVTETFSGTLNPSATDVHRFIAQTPGTLTISIVSVSPAIPLGIGLGIWDGTACTVQLSTNDARQSNTFNASVSSAGNYCLTVVDLGNIAEGETASYTVTLLHP